MNKKKKTSRIKHRKNRERMKKLLQTSLLKAKPKKVESENQPKVQPQGKDEVLLSEITEKSLAKAEFDEAKVNEIKAAIQEGKYPIDSKKIAESFLALEKMIGGK